MPVPVPGILHSDSVGRLKQDTVQRKAQEVVQLVGVSDHSGPKVSRLITLLHLTLGQRGGDTGQHVLRQVQGPPPETPHYHNKSVIPSCQVIETLMSIIMDFFWSQCHIYEAFDLDISIDVNS